MKQTILYSYISVRGDSMIVDTGYFVIRKKISLHFSTQCITPVFFFLYFHK